MQLAVQGGWHAQAHLTHRLRLGRVSLSGGGMEKKRLKPVQVPGQQSKTRLSNVVKPGRRAAETLLLELQQVVNRMK